nr:MAG TPA: hypothetical protein [Caudoviricetes sp.]
MSRDKLWRHILCFSIDIWRRNMAICTHIFF